MLCQGKLHTWPSPTCLIVKLIITYALTLTTIITVSFTSSSQGHSVSQEKSTDGTGPIGFNDHSGTGETVLKETLVHLLQLHQTNNLEVNAETQQQSKGKAWSGLQGWLIEQGHHTIISMLQSRNPFALGLSYWNTGGVYGFGSIQANNHIFLFLHTVY